MPMKIMVVDDEKPILDLIQTTIQSDGYEVFATSDSQTAADMLKNERFDGLLADVRMPNLDGFELTKVARASTMNSRIPVVLITGLSDVQTMREGFQAGATCFLAKPVGPKELTGLVRALRGSMLKERRRHARLPYRTAVTCQVEDRTARHFESVSVNIGEGGLLINPARGLEVGQQVRLDFGLPEGAMIEGARALVVRTDAEGGAGLEFIALPIEFQEAIRNFIINVVAS